MIYHFAEFNETLIVQSDCICSYNSVSMADKSLYEIVRQI